jgi:hypothetical protein
MLAQHPQMLAQHPQKLDQHSIKLDLHLPKLDLHRSKLNLLPSKLDLPYQSQLRLTLKILKSILVSLELVLPHQILASLPSTSQRNLH